MEFGDHHHLQDHHQEQRHVCKFCSKSFACGRSLGGHMRSHMINDTSAQADGSKIIRKKLPPLSTYLMSNPNPNPNPTNTKKKKKKQDSWALAMDSLSDNETTAPSKKKRSKRRRTRYTMGPANSSSVSFANNASSSASEVEQEQEEVAMCLILLSRDAGRWGGSNSLASDSLDNNSVSTRSTEVKNSPCEVKLKSLGELRLEKEEDCSKLGDRKTEFTASDGSKNPMGVDQGEVKEIGIDGAGEVVPDGCNHLIKRKSVDSFDPELKPDALKKFKALDGEGGSIRFECTTCNKVFHSYQALGGHRASHKKTKGCFASKIDSSENSIDTESSPDRTSDSNKLINQVQADQALVMDCEDRAETSNAARKSKGHECPICLKVFPSGQALGGHKRAHLVGAPNDHHRAKTVLQPVAAPSELMILDLNLPAPVEEESNGLVGFNPWWLGRSSHNCEPLLGLISN